MKKLFCLTALLLSVSMPVLAQGVPEVPQALEGLVERGAQIRYLGKEHGLDGWIAIYQGQEQFYYVTPDKKAFVTGLMFGADGRPVTIDQVRTLQSQGGALLDMLAEGTQSSAVPPAFMADAPLRTLAETIKEQTPSERLFADVENSNWIRLGNEGAPVIYSFIDPQCPHCHAMIQEMRDGYLDTGRLQLRMMPVGFNQTSLAQAALLLASPGAADLFYRHLDGDKDALPAKSDISTQAIQKNMALMQSWKFDVTPLLFYRAKDGSVKIVRGKPKDLNAILGDLPLPSSN